MQKKKSTRGRRPGQFGKGGYEGTPDIETVYHRAGVGNFAPETARLAYHLGRLARFHKDIMAMDRQTLKANGREIKIPQPILPASETLGKGGAIDSGKIQPGYNDLLWILSWQGCTDALFALGSIVRAAAEKDVNFFRELARRVEAAAALNVPLDMPAEPDFSALASLKEKYEKPNPTDLYDIANSVPSLAPVFKHPPGQRPPLTLAQISDYVRVFAKIKLSERALSDKAKRLGIPVAPRGFKPSKSNRELK